MRKLMLFTLGFASMTLGLVQFFDGSMWWLPLTFVLPTLVLFFFRGKARAVAILLLGAVLGGVFTSAYTDTVFAPPENLCTEETVFTARAENYPRETRYGYSLEVRVQEPAVPLTVVLYYSDAVDIAPGDTVTATARFYKTHDTEENEDLYYPAKGVGYTASVKGDMVVTPAEKVGILPTLTRFSHRLKENLRTVFSPESAGYFIALVTGDRSGLSYTFRNRMSLCGLYHAVSLSGMHVSILMGIIFLVCQNRRKWAAVLGVPALVLFLLLSGANPATVRAVIMQSILLFTAFLPREYDAPTALSAALMVLLLENPWCIAQWGLQLSFLSTAGILLLCPKLLHSYEPRRPKKKLLRAIGDFIVGSLAVTLSATVFTLPLMVYYFGMVSLVAPIANLLCLWAVTLSFCGGILVAFVAFLCLPLAHAMALPLQGLFAYLDAVVTSLSRIPFAAIYDGQPYFIAWSFLFYAALMGFFFFPKRWRLIALTSLLSLAVSLALTAGTVHREVFTVLSVGQGQSIVCTKGEDRYLIDCGGIAEKNGEDAARYLLSRGIYQMDAVVLTHFDLDHTIGLLHFLSRIPTATLYYSAETVLTEEIQALLKSAQSMGTKPCAVERMELPLKEGKLTLTSTVDGKNDNDNGLCILADTAKYDILVTGDLSQEGELRFMEHYRLPKADVLVAGHHGSKNSTSMALLQAVQPKIVLISVGENTYGHPAPETLSRIYRVGAKAYTTLENGNLTLRW